jgi:hypothetical protein
LHYYELACYVATFWVVLSHLLLPYVWCIMWYICIIHYTGQDEEGEVMCVSLPPPPPSNISWDQYINSPDEEYAAHSLIASILIHFATLSSHAMYGCYGPLNILCEPSYIVACSGHAIHVYVQRVYLLQATCCVGPSH